MNKYRQYTSSDFSAERAVCFRTSFSATCNLLPHKWTRHYHSEDICKHLCVVVFYFESTFWTRRTLLSFHLIVKEKNTARQNDKKAVIRIFCQTLGAVQIKNCLVKWAALSDWGLHNWWWQVPSRTCQSSNGAKVTRWLVMDLAVWIYSYSPTALTTRWTAAYSPIISCTFRLGSYMTFRKTPCHGADRIFWRCKLRFWHVISETGKKMLRCSEMVLNRKVLIYILCVHSEIKSIPGLSE